MLFVVREFTSFACISCSSILLAIGKWKWAKPHYIEHSRETEIGSI